MSPGVTILLVVVAGLAVMGAVQGWMRLRVAARHGQPAPDLPGELGAAVRRDA